MEGSASSGQADIQGSDMSTGQMDLARQPVLLSAKQQPFKATANTKSEQSIIPTQESSDGRRREVVFSDATDESLKDLRRFVPKQAPSTEKLPFRFHGSDRFRQAAASQAMPQETTFNWSVPPQARMLSLDVPKQVSSEERQGQTWSKAAQSPDFEIFRNAVAELEKKSEEARSQTLATKDDIFSNAVDTSRIGFTRMNLAFLEARVAYSKKVIAERDERTLGLEAQELSARQRLEQLEKEQKDARNRITSLEGNNARSSKVLVQKNEVILTLEAQKASLQQNMEGLNRKQKTSQDYIAVLEARVKAQQSERQAKIRTLDLLRHEAFQMAEKIERLETEKEESINEMETLRQEVVAQSSTHLEEQKAKIATLANVSVEKTKQIKHLEAKLAEQNRKVDDQEKTQKTAITELEAINKEQCGHLDSINKELAEKEKRLKALENEFATQNQDLKEARSKIVGKCEEIERLEKELAEHRGQLARQHTEVTTVIEKSSLLKTEVQNQCDDMVKALRQQAEKDRKTIAQQDAAIKNQAACIMKTPARSKNEQRQFGYYRQQPQALPVASHLSGPTTGTKNVIGSAQNQPPSSIMESFGGCHGQGGSPTERKTTPQHVNRDITNVPVIRPVAIETPNGEVRRLWELPLPGASASLLDLREAFDNLFNHIGQWTMVYSNNTNDTLIPTSLLAELSRNHAITMQQARHLLSHQSTRLSLVIRVLTTQIKRKLLTPSLLRSFDPRFDELITKSYAAYNQVQEPVASTAPHQEVIMSTIARLFRNLARRNDFQAWITQTTAGQAWDLYSQIEPLLCRSATTAIDTTTATATREPHNPNDALEHLRKIVHEAIRLSLLMFSQPFLYRLPFADVGTAFDPQYMAAFPTHRPDTIGSSDGDSHDSTKADKLLSSLSSVVVVVGMPVTLAVTPAVLVDFWHEGRLTMQRIRDCEVI